MIGIVGYNNNGEIMQHYYLDLNNFFFLLFHFQSFVNFF